MNAKSKLALLGCLFIFHCMTNAQAPPWQWGRDAGGAGNDIGKAISTDPNGNSYTTGRFTSTCTFGGFNITSYGGPDIYVSKYNSQGNCVWVKHGGSYDTNDIYGDEGDGIDIDADGNCYVTGNFYTQAMFGSFTLSCPTAHREIFVVKYDSSGNEIWARQADGNSNSYSRAIATDGLGNSYITGYLGGGVTTFGTFSVSGPGAFVVKYDSAGTPLFATKLCTNGGIDAYAIDIDQFGNSYITGYLQGSDIINGQTFTSSGDRDAFLIKVDALGNFLWLKQTQSIPGTTAYGWGVTVDLNNEPVITGDYDNFIMAGPFLLSGAGCLTIKYDSAGTPLWAKQSVSTGFGANVSGLAITSDSDKNIVITGNYSDTTNFDNVGLPNHGSQVFVVLYDSSGNCKWGTGSGGQNSGAFANGISTDNNGSYYVTGFYKAPPIFGNDVLAVYGGEDILVARLGLAPVVAAFSTPDTTLCPGTCLGFANYSLNAIAYQWYFPGGSPDTSTVVSPTNICYSNSGSYDVMLVATNNTGNDTLLFQNYISVYPAPAAQAILQSGDTLFANTGAVGYQWYYNSILIPGATFYYYVASQSGDFNVVATDENGCEVEAAVFDISASVQTALSSIQFTVFPNPVEDKLGIESRQYEIDVFSIYNVFGEKMLDQSLSKKNITDVKIIDLSKYKGGIYFIEIISGVKTYRTKFIKNN
ncbi:MAG: T9SS type A sorting domain-containing protein [Bacteroidota bacterium]